MLPHLRSLLALLPILAGPAIAYQAEDEVPQEPGPAPICDATLICPHVCEACPLDFQPKPYPKRNVPNVFIGWANGTSYLETGLFGPMLIPVEIASQDPDEIHIKCAGGCQRMNWQGDWTIDWQVTGHDPSHVYPFRQGSFVNAQATRLGTIQDRWAVLYLPPEDLLPGETRQVAFKATIRDLCPQAVDQQATVDFSGTVKRDDAGMWEVSLKHTPPSVPNETQEPCDTAPALCELVGFAVLPDTFPEERFRDLPAKMYVDEVRALTLAAKDCDKVLAECGIPQVFCSTFCNRKVCDEVSYVWWVSHVNPWEVGTGEFEKFGTTDPSSSHMPRSQTVMFTATHTGLLRIYIQANSKSGDATVFFHDMEIVERKTWVVDHHPSGQHDIFLDGSMVTKYKDIDVVGIPGAEWVDSNDNGNATDMGDFNFPMAYTKNTFPILSGFAQKAFETACMPGAIIHGFGMADTPNVEFHSPLNYALHYLLPNFLVGTEFTNFGSFPDRVGRWEHRVRWEVTYVPTRPVVHRPEHPYRVYTTLAAPQGFGLNSLNPAFYKYWETAYDISCRAAQNATTAPAVFSGVNAKFASSVVNFKDFDGANVSDGAQIRYWGEPTQPYNQVNPVVGAMLGGGVGTTRGVGACQAVAGLFKLCLAVQGQPSVMQEFHAYSRPRRWNGTTTYIDSTPLEFEGLRQWFLVKDYNFLAPAGDQSAILYFDAGNNQQQPPAGPLVATNTDPNRGLTFHFVDMTHPFNATWQKVVDVSGKGGIGVVDPRSLFTEHALVEYSGAYYDPSYADATAWPTAEAYAANALAGVCTWDLMRFINGGAEPFTQATVAFQLQLWAANNNRPYFKFVPRTHF